jgi:hypothetical protein
MGVLAIDPSLDNAGVAIADANNGNSVSFMFDKPHRARPTAISLLRSTKTLNCGSLKARSHTFQQTRDTACVTCDEI